MARDGAHRRTRPIYHQVAAGVVAAAVLLSLSVAEAKELDRQALRRLGGKMTDALRAERWQKAIDLGEQIVEARPDDPAGHYNLACALSLAGESDRAVAALGRSAELGFSFVSTFDDDEDLDPIRDHPGFEAIAKLVHETHEREFALVRERTAESRPILVGPPEAEWEGELPLLIILHGRGGRAGPLAKSWVPSAAKRKIVVVAPEAFTPYGGGFEWRKIDDALHRIEHAVEYAAAHFPIDRDRVVVGGFSQGAFVSMVSAARQRDLVAGALVVGSCVEEGVELDDVEDPAGFPIYIGAGSEDRIHPACKPMAKSYREAGFDVKRRTYPDVGHSFPYNWEWELDRALEHVLPPVE